MQISEEKIIAHLDAHAKNVHDAIAHLRPTTGTRKREIAETLADIPSRSLK